MTNAYKHVAIPVAITLGAAAFVGALVLEVRARRHAANIPLTTATSPELDNTYRNAVRYS